MAMNKKRSIDEVDDEPQCSSHGAKFLRLDLPHQTPITHPLLQPRILPFRASPTSKHTLSFAHCVRDRPATLISASGALTPDESSDDEGGKPRGFFLLKPAELNLHTPPQTKSSTRPNFDAFSTMRETSDIDIDMVDSPAPPSLSWASSPCSPHSHHPKHAYFQASTSPSLSFSHTTSFTQPLLARNSQFKLQPPPRRDQIIGGRIPTPTYGHFSLVSDDEISPRTRQKGSSFLRRAACPERPITPISEDEFESTSGILGKLSIESPTIARNQHLESPARARRGGIYER